MNPGYDEHDDGDSICSDSSSQEDYFDDDEDDELAMLNGGDDVESYNRMFLQQQQIGQKRHQEEELKQAKKRRKQIAEAILSGIHLNAASRKSLTTSSTKGEESRVYSILRSPDGTTVFKVPLEAANSFDGAGKDNDVALNVPIGGRSA